MARKSLCKCHGRLHHVKLGEQLPMDVGFVLFFMHAKYLCIM